jgi:hypothetical protein
MAAADEFGDDRPAEGSKTACHDDCAHAVLLLGKGFCIRL